MKSLQRDFTNKAPFLFTQNCRRSGLSPDCGSLSFYLFRLIRIKTVHAVLEQKLQIGVKPFDILLFGILPLQEKQRSLGIILAVDGPVHRLPGGI